MGVRSAPTPAANEKIRTDPVATEEQALSVMNIKSCIYNAHKSGADGEPNQMRVVLSPDLALNGIVMIANGFLAEIKELCDRFACHARGKQAKNFCFARAQVLDNSFRSCEPVGCNCA